jgi:hypothetical protein
MAFVTEYTESLKPIREYLVEITGIYEETIQHGTLLLHAPSNIFNETNGLCEEGKVKKAPMKGGMEEELVGERVRFWFTEAHSVYKGNSPKINGHLLVLPQSIIGIGDRMVGEYIYCKPIMTARSKSGLIIPNIELISYDTLQKPVEKIREFYTDRGVVSGKNEIYPEGTVLYWGDDSNVRLGWNGGFLVRSRVVIAHGPDAEFMSYIKKKR